MTPQDDNIRRMGLAIFHTNAHSVFFLVKSKLIWCSDSWGSPCIVFLSVVLNNYVIKQIAVKSIHKLILFIEQK